VCSTAQCGVMLLTVPVSSGSAQLLNFSFSPWGCRRPWGSDHRRCCVQTLFLSENFVNPKKVLLPSSQSAVYDVGATTVVCVTVLRAQLLACACYCRSPPSQSTRARVRHAGRVREHTCVAGLRSEPLLRCPDRILGTVCPRILCLLETGGFFVRKASLSLLPGLLPYESPVWVL